MNQRELKQSIEEDPNLTDSEKARKLNALCAPYTKMSDAELLQLVRDFTMEYGREPTRKDVLYDRELKKRFGPWTRMLEKAGTRPVAEHYLEGKKRRRAQSSSVSAAKNNAPPMMRFRFRSMQKHLPTLSFPPKVFFYAIDPLY